MSAEFEVINPDGLHTRAASIIAEAVAGFAATVSVQNLRTGAAPVTITGTLSIQLLAARHGDRLAFTAQGVDADAALDTVGALLRAGFGELDAERAEVPSVGSAGPGRDRGTGLGVSAGRAVGPALRMPEPVAEPAASTVADATAEVARIEAAAAAVAYELRERAARVEGTARAVLEAQASLAADRALLDRAAELAAVGAESAVWAAVTEFADLVASGGGRAGERAADLHDVRGRLIAELFGRPTPGVPFSAQPFVLVAHDLAPADTALLDPATCLAIVTEQGGPTSHTAILARGLGIPTVVAFEGALGIDDGTLLFVDGAMGRVVANPDAQLVAEVANAPAVPAFSGRGETRDGHAVPLLANVGSPRSVAEAMEAGAQGVGLFRTELCFLGRATAPSVEEQVAAYRPVFATFAGRRVVVRTLDAGADKPLDFVTDEGQPNPALGVRGLRTARRHPELLDDQLRAIALAAAAESADVWVMAPMVATVDEAERFAADCARHGLERVGATIETPAAALLAPELNAVLDFTSIGTNDLAQYTMAADRQHGALGALNDPWQPAVLRLIRIAAQAGVAAGKPVGLCGEAGSDPLLAAVLVGLGVDSLSMSPRAIAPVAAALAALSLEQCQRAAEAACGSATAANARQTVGEVLSPSV